MLPLADLVSARANTTIKADAVTAVKTNEIMIQTAATLSLEMPLLDSIALETGASIKADRRLRRLPGPTADNTIHVLKHAIDKHGRPRELLTDRGSQFYANEAERREKGISQFEAFLAENGIKHLLCRVNHPQTNGKLERIYGVYEQKRHQFKSIDEYVQWHNEIKPHLSLNIKNLETPIQAFQRKLPPKKIELTQTIEDAK